MNEVYNFINQLKINNSVVILAISGGPDSMFLLNLMLKLRDKLNLTLVVAHVHHNIRKESDYEAEKVKEYCDNNNIIFEMMKIENYPDNKFSEEVARNIRYNFFDKLINKYNSDILFTAHHGDDLIETVLMRISRGSTLKGYAGFERISCDRGYKIARPLVFLTKDYINDYLIKNNIWFAVDMSNKNQTYTRNRYRNNILPVLKDENINIHSKIIDFSDKLLLANEYINKQMLKYKYIINQNEIDIIEFNKLDKILKIYLLEHYLKKIYKENIKLISNTHIEIILNQLSKSKNTKINLPMSKIGLLEYNKFKIINCKKQKEYEYIFNDEIILPNGNRIIKDNDTKLTSNYVIHLNSREIKLPFHVRTRKKGDFMYVKNMLGKKKINDIFIDSKISKELRDEYPIVTDDTGEIIWIPGIKKSHLDRKKEEKYDIILKYTYEEA